MVKSLGWSRQFEPSMQRLFNGVTRCLDAGLADGHFFLNIASIGFDAQVLVEIASLHKKKWAKLSYLYGLLVALKTYEDLPVRFAEAPSAEHSLFLFAAGNGAYYGGGFQILPQADPTDGVLDFCAVCDIPRRTLLRLLPSVVRATHVRHTEYVQMSRAPKRSVEVLAPFYLNLDGELRTYSQGARVEFSVCPQSLVLLGGSGEQK